MYYFILSVAIRATRNLLNKTPLILTYLTLDSRYYLPSLAAISFPSCSSYSSSSSSSSSSAYCLFPKHVTLTLSQVGAPYLSPSPLLHPNISPYITYFSNSTHPPTVPSLTRDYQLLFIILHLLTERNSWHLSALKTQQCTPSLPSLPSRASL